MSEFRMPPFVVERKLAEILAGAGQIAQQAQDASMGLMLFPDIRKRSPAFVRFCPVDLDGADDDQAWPKLQEWLVPDEPWDESAEITQIATEAGYATSPRQQRCGPVSCSLRWTPSGSR